MVVTINRIMFSGVDKKPSMMDRIKGLFKKEEKAPQKNEQEIAIEKTLKELLLEDISYATNTIKKNSDNIDKFNVQIKEAKKDKKKATVIHIKKQIKMAQFMVDHATKELKRYNEVLKEQK